MNSNLNDDWNNVFMTRGPGFLGVILQRPDVEDQDVPSSVLLAVLLECQQEAEVIGGVDVEKDVIFGVNVKAKSDKLPIIIAVGGR
jgi:hypothetical protein